MNPNRRSRATYGIASTGKSGILSGWSSTPRSNGRKRPSNRNTCWICRPWLRTRRSERGAAPLVRAGPPGPAAGTTDAAFSRAPSPVGTPRTALASSEGLVDRFLVGFVTVVALLNPAPLAEIWVGRAHLSTVVQVRENLLEFSRRLSAVPRLQASELRVFGSTR